VRDLDTLGERLGEILDRIASVKGAKGRRFRQRAVAGGGNCMTARAIGLGKGAPALDLRRLSFGCSRYEETT